MTQITNGKISLECCGIEISQLSRIRRASLFWFVHVQAGPQVCLPVQYEDLVLHPKPAMEKVLKFLDVPWDDWVLHHEQTIGKEKGVSLSQ